MSVIHLHRPENRRYTEARGRPRDAQRKSCGSTWSAYWRALGSGTCGAFAVLAVAVTAAGWWVTNKRAPITNVALPLTALKL